VGEAENLAGQLQGYLHPGPSQQTNKRIKERFDRDVQTGSRIELHMVKFRDFHVLMDQGNETHELISANTLSNPFVRKLVENIGVILHDARYCEILNKAHNPMERRADKVGRLSAALDAMSSAEKASFYAKLGLTNDGTNAEAGRSRPFTASVGFLDLFNA
jgi:hypothetical protein